MAGLGTDICFLGAREDVSTYKKDILPPLPVNLLLMLGRFDNYLVFLSSGEYALFFIGYNISCKICIILLNI